MAKDADFLGSGWSFPPAFTRTVGTVEMLHGAEDIDSSLEILLGTVVGSRIMQPRYGCNLREYLHEPMDVSIQSEVRKLVEDAILYFEPRIKLRRVDLAVDQGCMQIAVDYTIKSTNSRGNFVYPFYLKKEPA